MKTRIIGLLLIGLIFINSAYASTTNKSTTQKSQTSTEAKQQITFNNKVFRLKYSAYSPMSKTYMNEYYRIKENGDNWKELIGIHHVKNYKTPIKYANDLGKVAETSSNIKSDVVQDKTTGTAYVTFILFGSNKIFGNYAEHNTFKAEKVDGKKGIIAMQYAYRYPINTKEEQELFTKQIEQNTKKSIRLLNKTPIPKLVEKNIEQW